MRILVAAFAYNERPYIPYMVDYYRSQGCDLLILDNHSTDGTYEWLLENGIKTGRVNTRDAFFLRILQTALNHRLQKERPDWVVYTGIDAYYHFPGTIKEEIEKAEAEGCTIIETKHLEIYYTGEERKLPLPDHFFYVKDNFSKPLRMIGKFSSFFQICSDAVHVTNTRIYKNDGIFINYGMCKTKEEREETFQRRIKAWELGERRGRGVHYQPAHEQDWIWNKEDLIDIRKTDYYKMMVR